VGYQGPNYLVEEINMFSTKPQRLVTLKRECFDVQFRGNVPGNRDGVLHHFHLNDLTKKRSVLRISVFRGGPKDMYAPAPEYDLRENTVVLNAVRRAFDNGAVSMDVANEGPNYVEISLQPSDFIKQSPKTDAEIRSYMINKAYLLGYRYPTQMSPADELYPIPFNEEIDLDYLGVAAPDILRNIRRLSNQGFFENVLEASASPSEKLLSFYESVDTDDRKFAREAIDEARKSVSEPDGKIHPMVGAVVVKDGRVLSKAHRGELPQNHAEYVTLEMKLPDDAVSGATVYTTLEPCTTRNHPKIPCADRLIERKVTRVVVGMLDPDPRITGQGLRKLRSANIIIDFFPSDLMTEVEELNREFTRFCTQQTQLKASNSEKQEEQIDNLKGRIIELSRKPYLEHLGKNGEILLSRLSENGKRLLRHLLQNEPLEVGRKFTADISDDEQFKQLTIARDMGIIRHREFRVGSGTLLRTDYEVNPQYRPVLEDLLYRAD
jgi:pyrimidine deaminase RibD-like protein